MTGHHRDPKRKLRVGFIPERRDEVGVLCAVTHTFAYWTSITVTHVIFFIVECGIAPFLYTMRVFDVRASSSPLDYFCAKFRFCRAPIAELARREKLRTQSLNHLVTQLITQLI